MSNLSSSKTCC